MFAVMYQDEGVGLAAPQVGVNVRLMVFNPEGSPSKRSEEVALVNPAIVSTSKNKVRGEEGCLSFRDDMGLILGDVDRAQSITIAAQDLDGKPFKLDLSGWTARIFQHEYDHLNGVLLCDRFVPESMALRKERFVGMEDRYAAAHPDTKIRRLKK